MSLSPRRSKSILSYLAGGKPTRTPSSSKRQTPSDKPQSKNSHAAEDRHQATNSSRSNSKSHQRHKSSRSEDLGRSFRGDPNSHQAEPQHQRQGSCFEDDSDDNQGKEKSFFSRAVSYVEDRRLSYTSENGENPVDEQKSPTTPRHREPTIADANKHHILPGRCLRHWDPDEAPIMLLTSVLDSNSLGKWLLDQTARIYGEYDDMSDLAAEFWFEHIKLGGKLKQAKERLPKITDSSVRHRVEEFILFGDRLVNELDQRLKKCEQRVLEVTGISEMPKLGHRSVVVFIDSFLGRNPAQREACHDLTRSIREWNIWFDTSCASLLT
ncbi:hypothetical protein Daus18300_011052 [Diaporthe australafricana]|uniref:Vegetative cell wall protein gp1 n=1 Tax=Diaporthe australafricana TaxID=127596 RepID=A0ABR3W819_9PEZI